MHDSRSLPRALLLALVALSHPAFADSFQALDKLDAAAVSKAPEVELREALVLARRGCEDRISRDEQACVLQRELEPMLREFERSGEGAATARRVLGARLCRSALAWDGMEIDAAVRVMSWCGAAFDGCEPGLMRAVGIAAKIDRTVIVGGACAEKVCPSTEVPASACAKRDGRPDVKTSSDVLALLKVVFARELPLPVALELHAAFASPRYPFFVDLPVPRKLNVATLKTTAKTLAPKLAKRSAGESYEAVVERLGAPHKSRDESGSWYAREGKACVELRLTFDPALKLEVRSPPLTDCD